MPVTVQRSSAKIYVGITAFLVGRVPSLGPDRLRSSTLLVDLGPRGRITVEVFGRTSEELAGALAEENPSFC